MQTGIAVAVLLAAAACCSGCAAPGLPLPPTLNLPEIVSSSGLSATRIGGEVTLHWTTPKQTTDKLPVKGAIAAEICRSPLSVMPLPAQAPCVAVARLTAAPGKSDAVDVLPEALIRGPARLLAYRVQLLNAAGKTAGPSAAVYAPAGPAPAAVADFAGDTTSAGVELHWQRAAEAETIELNRTLLDPSTAATPRSHGSLPGAQRQPVDVRLRATESNSPEAGGMVDRTVELGHSYKYTAQRVESIVLGGQTLELRSAPSTALTFAVRDVFPPGVPQGLVAVPGFAGNDPVIDLSWEPVTEQDVKPKVAGYKVSRRDDAGAWRLLGIAQTAAFRDATVVAGRSYSYHVTSISTTGNESAASGEATETAPRVQP